MAWLAILGAMVAVALVSGAFASAPTAALLVVGLYLAALGLSFAGARETTRLLRQSRDALSDAANARKMTPNAREATQRARRRGAAGDGLVLLDIGLITTQGHGDGMTMRRTRAVSLDEDGVRPYVTLQVDPREADRSTIIRFEMLDTSGQSQYIHEQKTFLRDGQMNIIADHHLPLADNPRANTVGDWDLRVSVNGDLLGAQTFTVSPSLEDRFRARPGTQDAQHSAQPGAVSRRRIEDVRGEGDAPLSLEDLLRSQQQDNARRNQR